MHLAQLTIENFRIFGSRTEGQHLDLRINRGLTVLVGENDSGKTAILDALRLVLCALVTTIFTKQRGAPQRTSASTAALKT
jgi:predicted ATP-dependent endonuclease of OLD family